MLLSNDYTLDSRGRRTASAREDGVGWSYGYNERGEVTSGSRGAQSFGYTYDEIGNRISPPPPPEWSRTGSKPSPTRPTR